MIIIIFDTGKQYEMEIDPHNPPEWLDRNLDATIMRFENAITNSINLNNYPND